MKLIDVSNGSIAIAGEMVPRVLKKKKGPGFCWCTPGIIREAGTT